MKRLTQILLMLILTLLLSGCNPSAMLNNRSLDTGLPKMYNIRTVVDSTSIAFEWELQYKRGIDGINVYRSAPFSNQSQSAIPRSETKQLVKVATISNPFTTHYVDTGLQENSHYTYTFTTIRGEYESMHGQMVEVKTLPKMQPVVILQAKQYASNTIKLLWRPHPDRRVKRYRVERRLDSSQKYNIIGYVENRMMSEFVDNYVSPENIYHYRVIAIAFDGTTSRNSKALTIKAKVQ